MRLRSLTLIWLALSPLALPVAGGTGFDIITWSFERADLRKGGANAGFYYYFDPTSRALKKDSDMYQALDTLAQQAKIRGIFSDWPASVTYYANCMGLE